MPPFTGEHWPSGRLSSARSAHPHPVTRTGPPDYVLCMLSTLLVICGVLVGLLVLLAVIVGLSARPAPSTAGRNAGRAPAWVADAGRPHPDAWSPLSTGNTSEMPTVR